LKPIFDYGLFHAKRPNEREDEEAIAACDLMVGRTK
jgi:hypothetical protein